MKRRPITTLLLAMVFVATACGSAGLEQGELTLDRADGEPRSTAEAADGANAEEPTTEPQQAEPANAVVTADSSSDQSADDNVKAETSPEAHSAEPGLARASTHAATLVPQPSSVGVCLAVSLGDQRLLNKPGERVGNAVEVRLTDGQYEVRLFSTDELHASGDQFSQAEEQWVLEFLDAAGAVVAETRPTSDLGDADLERIDAVGSYNLAGVAAVRPRHLGAGGVNSIVASQVVFSNTDCPDATDPPGDGPSPPGDEDADDPPDPPVDPGVGSVSEQLTAATNCDQILAIVEDQIRVNPEDYFFEADGSEPDWHQAFSAKYVELSCEVVPL